MEFSLENLEEKYFLELDLVVSSIKDGEVKSVLIQLPDGLKPYSLAIVDYLSGKVDGVEIRIFLGDCFGACDVPETDCDLVVQFGHSEWV
ncbi:MAG: diphthamide synthesis protein [archaeon]